MNEAAKIVKANYPRWQGILSTAFNATYLGQPIRDLRNEKYCKTDGCYFHGWVDECLECGNEMEDVINIKYRPLSGYDIEDSIKKYDKDNFGGFDMGLAYEQ